MEITLFLLIAVISLLTIWQLIRAAYYKQQYETSQRDITELEFTSRKLVKDHFETTDELRTQSVFLRKQLDALMQLTPEQLESDLVSDLVDTRVQQQLQEADDRRRQAESIQLATITPSIDINTATAETLDRELPYIGYIHSRSIVRYRNQHGNFESNDDLVRVDGIGLYTLEVVRPYLLPINVEPPTPPTSRRRRRGIRLSRRNQDS